jgi:CBS domain-containing protein
MSAREAFQRTLDGLDKGIQVHHIASFDLECCSPQDTVKSVMERGEWLIFSQILVRDEGRAVGIIERTGAETDNTVARQMRPLSDAMLISATAPLSEFLKICRCDTFRLVVDTTRIAGIVTVSDLQKLPVRLHTFARIAHLEMLMSEIITIRSSGKDDLWKHMIAARRILNAENYRAEYRRDNLDLPLIEYTDFGDKVKVISRLVQELCSASTELKEVETLRHLTMHNRPVDASGQGVSTFLDRLSLAERWIERMHDFATVPYRNEEKTN